MKRSAWNGIGRVFAIVGLATAAALSDGPAAAQTVTGRDARALLFAPNGVYVQVFAAPSLSAQDIAVIGEIAATQRYYGAVALSPDQGLASEATLAAVGYHDVASARTVALADCDAKRRADSAPCIVVAEITPAGWEPRALQLSADATVAFREDYGRGRATRAMAISPSTGKWAIVRDAAAPDAALAACAVQSGATDCRVAIAD